VVVAVLGVFKRFFDLLTSTRIGIALMTAVAVLSFLGAMIPQGGAREAYLVAYGSLWGRAIWALQLNDVFRAGYFTALLVLLCVMVFACSLKRLPRRIRLATRKEFIFDEARLRRMPRADELVVDVDDDEAALHIADVCKRHLYSVSTESRGRRRAVFASKAGFSRYGSFLLHLSFIFLLIGGISSTRLGSRYHEEVRVGSSFDLPVSGTDRLPVTVEDFTVELDERDRISDYVCEVGYRDEGGVATWFRIRPNHPLRFADREVYLVSFAEDPEVPEGFIVTAYDPAGELIIPHFFAGIDDPVYVEPLEGAVQASLGVVPSLRLITDDGRVETYIIESEPSGSGQLTGRYRFVLVHAVPSVVVTLEVVKEPGQSFIMAGLVLLTAGTFISLYLSHRRIWFIVSMLPERKAKVVSGGMANRNRDAFSREYDDIRSTLGELS
jgi:cytochrome c biogenesis protein